MQVKKKLLDVVRDKVRFKHYSLSTEKTYVHWIKHYIFFHKKKHPIEMAKPEIEAFYNKGQTLKNYFSSFPCARWQRGETDSLWSFCFGVCYSPP